MAKKSMCEVCGITLDGEAKFCPTCGGQLKVTEIDIPEMNIDSEPVNTENTASFDDIMNGGNTQNDAGIPPVPPYNEALNAAMNNNSGSTTDSANNTDAANSSIPNYGPVNNQFSQYTTNNMVNPQPEQPKSSKDGLAVAGMVLGIISLALCCLNIIDLPIAIVGLILSILGIKSKRRSGMAIAGTVCSAIAVVACLSIFFVGLNKAKKDAEIADDIIEEIMDEFEDKYDYEYKYDWK